MGGSTCSDKRGHKEKLYNVKPKQIHSNVSRIKHGYPVLKSIKIRWKSCMNSL